tara:strand:+ start:3314 stop:3517 length:204 start_codon:yes stop_codon:yes gene_type:complete
MQRLWNRHGWQWEVHLGRLELAGEADYPSSSWQASYPSMTSGVVTMTPEFPTWLAAQLLGLAGHVKI